MLQFNNSLIFFFFISYKADAWAYIQHVHQSHAVSTQESEQEPWDVKAN